MPQLSKTNLNSNYLSSLHVSANVIKPPLKTLTKYTEVAGEIFGPQGWNYSSIDSTNMRNTVNTWSTKPEISRISPCCHSRNLSNKTWSHTWCGLFLLRCLRWISSLPDSGLEIYLSNARGFYHKRGWRVGWKCGSQKVISCKAVFSLRLPQDTRIHTRTAEHPWRRILQQIWVTSVLSSCIYLFPCSPGGQRWSHLCVWPWRIAQHPAWHVGYTTHNHVRHQCEGGRTAKQPLKPTHAMF